MIQRSMFRRYPFYVVVGVGLFVQACSNGSGRQGQEYPAPPGVDDDSIRVIYNGPSPSTNDVQNFKLEFWEKIASDERCGACHVENDQSPYFARRDDINLAYTAANGVVNLEDPTTSEIVDKVATGHGCWSENTGFCVEQITTWIANWASQSGVELTDTDWQHPELQDVSASLTFPDDAGAFATHVHPLLKQYCTECHRADAPQAPVQPYLAATDVSTAYLAAQTKMLFNTIQDGNGYQIDVSRSRLVQRLREESHNCWDNDCDASADAMEAALSAFAATLEMREPDGDLIASKAMRINEGMAISQGGRVETNAVAMYSFKAGQGRTVSDYAGDAFPPALDLTLNGDVEWVSNWGVRINNGRVQGAVSASRKLHRYITQTGEYSVEAWVVPANVSQDGPARIVSYSGNNAERNFTLGQTLYNYDFFNRSSESNGNGAPILSTPDAQEVLQATLQHVVASYDAITGRRLYVNGQLIDVADPLPAGNLNGWDDNFVLVVGNETSGEYPWQGTVRLLAIHNRALTPEQVQINYQVGVGQKILVAFSVSHLIDGMDDAYVVFQVEQFDDYSYLFNEPYFYSNSESPSQDVRIQGMRIGVNGREAKVGQVFANLDATIVADQYAAQEKVPLSRLGAIIELAQGPDLDQFFLTFDRIGVHQFTRQAPPSPPSATPEDLPPQARIGVRTFAEINASLSAMTGIPVTHSGVTGTFEKVNQQMPVDENVKGFLVAHQMGITQLAVKYCNVLAGDSARRQAFFPAFNGTTFDSAGRNGVIDPLLRALLAHSVDGEGPLLDQPDEADSRLRLNDLIDTMTQSCGAGVCNTTVAENTVTAVCAAALGSALMLIQ